jgi:hypothetical protein
VRKYFSLNLGLWVGPSFSQICLNFILSFVLSFFLPFLVLPLLSTYCRFWVLLLQVVTLKDTHTHIHTLSRTPLDERSLHPRDLSLTKQNILQQPDILCPRRDKFSLYWGKYSISTR